MHAKNDGAVKILMSPFADHANLSICVKSELRIASSQCDYRRKIIFPLGGVFCKLPTATLLCIRQTASQGIPRLK